MSKLWFRRKAYGWGWVPATWEAWVTMVVFILVIAGGAVATLRPSTLPWGFIAYFAIVAIATLGIVALCYAKGERPRWQWGESDRHKE